MNKEQDSSKDHELVRFFALVEDDLLDRIDEVAETMQKKGFNVERIRKYTGTISGSANSINMIEDAHIKGVKIRPETTYRLETIN